MGRVADALSSARPQQKERAEESQQGGQEGDRRERLSPYLERARPLWGGEVMLRDERARKEK
jgi:hypothetical protein